MRRGLGWQASDAHGAACFRLEGPLLPCVVRDLVAWLDASSAASALLDLQHARECAATWGVWVWLVDHLRSGSRRPAFVPPREVIVMALLAGAGLAPFPASTASWSEPTETELRERLVRGELDSGWEPADDPSRPWRVYGRTWAQERSEARFARAMTLLVSSDLKLAAIARGVGWSSVGSFVERFTEQVGISPDAFRRRYRG